MPRLIYFLKYGCHAVHHHRGCKVHTFAIHVPAILTMKKKGCMVFYFYAYMWFHSYGCMVLCLTHLQAARPLLLNLTASDHGLTILCVVKGPQGTQKLVITAIQ